MRRIFAAAAMLSLLASPAAIGSPKPDDAHVLGDLCATSSMENPPFSHVYHLRNGGTVVFVAVAHTKDLSSPTIAQIRAAFERYKPGVVLVEGASFQKSADARYLKYLSDAANQQFASGHIQENLFAVKLAVDGQARFIGWDLSPHEEYISDIANGFSMNDAVGAHLLRSKLDPFGIPNPSVVQTELNSVPHVRTPDGFDYPQWYRKTYGDTFDASAGTPCGKGVASQIVKSESIRRTMNIVTLLDTYATPGSVVMVEAGANHWLALRDYLASISRRAD